jgi:TonB-linked SusC/RagA family outer membrane protein
VTGSEDGMEIPGVSVFVKGTTVGTVTLSNGTYTLNVPQDATTLVFSFVGMQKQEVPIQGRSVINIELMSETIAMDEVVVTALGIRRERKALGYAVQDVSADEIAKTGNSDLASAMQGKLAGMDIKPSSGMPGASSQIVIRGARSFTDNNTPLYVVDGMPIASTADYTTGNSVTGADISNRAVDINPADIESINVLKGQAAAALYGIRASNGVVIITTKSGANNKIGKAVVSLSHNSSFDIVSRTPDYQTTYAQGSYGSYVPTTSFSWGPKIMDLPDDPSRGGNANGYPGKFYVPQLERGGLDPWVTPKVYNNWDDYYQTGYKTTNNINVSQAFESGNFAISLTNTRQDGIALNTGMDRWNFKGSADKQLNDHFKVGFTTNYSKLGIDKLSGANDASLAGVLSAPSSYNLKGYPFAEPGDPYSQIYYRSMTFDNPYWIARNNTFNEKTERFFGNGYINYSLDLGSDLSLGVKYMLGVDTYTTHYQDIFGYGSKGDTGIMDNYGVSSATYNSLLTASLDWTVSENSVVTAIFGNELNHEDRKFYEQHGEDFNFGGWAHIQNANTVTADETQEHGRAVGFFGNVTYAWRSMLYLNATGRYDIVSTMPRDNRSFFYPSVSLGFVASELDAVKSLDWISFAKVRASYAEVGQAGEFYQNFFTKPDYSGGFWTGEPITYPVYGVNSYISNNIQYDPNLKPQNTKSYEIGVDLKFVNNRFGIDYTYSRQNVKDQIFPVPLAGSTGAAQLVMNGGSVHTNSHEVIFYVSPISTRDFNWDINVNFAQLENVVDELAPGVESIFLGGFVTPQVRAGIGANYPVIYGTSFKRDDQGNILVIDNPGAWNHGMPQQGEPAVIGEVSPDFILGATNTFSYKSVSLSAVFEWKNGGEMYSGSNGLLDLYGMSARVEDRESTFIYDGYKPNGEPNDIARGGSFDPDAVQDLYTNVLSNIDEYYIHENSFVKLRELSLRYHHPTKVFESFDVGISLFARNILLWTALENFDPESSQGNNNMGGSFERFSLPQTTSFGFGIDVNF